MFEKKGNIQLLNLAKLQYKLDQNVFENIDTAQNWQKASELLKELTVESQNFYIQYVENNNGQLPKANSYWTLFMELVSKITYFSTFVEQQQSITPESLMKKFAGAALFLPNCEHESCEEYYEEIRTSYYSVANEPLKTMNYSVEQTLVHYNEYVTTLK